LPDSIERVAARTTDYFYYSLQEGARAIFHVPVPVIGLWEKARTPFFLRTSKEPSGESLMIPSPRFYRFGAVRCSYHKILLEGCEAAGNLEPPAERTIFLASRIA
jgi:hypothetical protein